MNKLVKDFAPTGSAAEQLLQYPFSRPLTSYITNGEHVLTLPENYEDFVVAADEYLQSQQLPPIAERVAVVGYGANVSPYKLHLKMAKYGDPEVWDALQVTPNLRVTIPQTVIAWHGKPGQNGSVFAELYRSEETAGESADAFIQFLTVEQLAALHASEGGTYHFSLIEVLADKDKRQVKAYAYVAKNSEILFKDGNPVQVAACAKPSASVVMTAEQAVGYMLEHAQGVVNTVSPVTYIEQAPKRLVEKKARQEAVGARLAIVGLSRTFTFPNSEGFKARADFNFSKDAQGGQRVELMEQTVARLRPSMASLQAAADGFRSVDPQMTFIEAMVKARKQHDIAQVLRGRAHDELAQSLEQ